VIQIECLQGQQRARIIKQIPAAPPQSPGLCGDNNKKQRTGWNHDGSIAYTPTGNPYDHRMSPHHQLYHRTPEPPQSVFQGTFLPQSSFRSSYLILRSIWCSPEHECHPSVNNLPIYELDDFAEGSPDIQYLLVMRDRDSEDAAKENDKCALGDGKGSIQRLKVDMAELEQKLRAFCSQLRNQPGLWDKHARDHARHPQLYLARVLGPSNAANDVVSSTCAKFPTSCAGSRAQTFLRNYFCLSWVLRSPWPWKTSEAWSVLCWKLFSKLYTKFRGIGVRHSGT